MELERFKEEAIRTESVLDELQVNHNLFNGLQLAFVNIADCLDLLKKKVYYGKDIDLERLESRLSEARNVLTAVSIRAEKNPVAVNNQQPSPLDARQFHGVLGIATEAAELLELIDLSKPELSRVDTADELGDGFWYTAILADSMDLQIEEQVLDAVIDKLRKRFPDKFDAAKAINKDKESEKKVTSDVVSKKVSKKKASKKRAAKKNEDNGD